jgi:hypothetical protein
VDINWPAMAYLPWLATQKVAHILVDVLSEVNAMVMPARLSSFFLGIGVLANPTVTLKNGADTTSFLIPVLTDRY